MAALSSKLSFGFFRFPIRRMTSCIHFLNYFSQRHFTLNAFDQRYLPIPANSFFIISMIRKLTLVTSACESGIIFCIRSFGLINYCKSLAIFSSHASLFSPRVEISRKPPSFSGARTWIPQIINCDDITLFGVKIMVEEGYLLTEYKIGNKLSQACFQDS